jgi:alginate O-acetyltransferase complex protein AlgJ
MATSFLTGVSPRKAVMTVGLLALLVASVPVNWHFFRSGPDHAREVPQNALAFVGGDTTAAITDNYNQGFLLRDAGIDLFGTLSWALFHEGRKGVLAGEHGWLFSAEEFETDADSAERVVHAADFMADVKDRLAEQGVALAVAIVPAKASIYPEELGRYRQPAEPRGRYERLLALLAERGVDAIDLRPALQGAKTDGATYLHTDTHWTPFGATVAANAIAAHLAGADLGDTVTGFARQDLPPAEYSGDLTRFVRIAPFARSLAPHPDTLDGFEAEASGAAGGGLFDDGAIPVTLVGTSYSANAKWSFEAALKLALSRDVLNVAAEGEGPFKPMSDYLRSPTFTDAPPRLVIWEVPERFVDDAYDDAVFRLD